MRKKNVGTLVPSEHCEQVELFARIRRLLPEHPDLGKVFAIPNGTRTSIHTAKKMRAEGVKAGVPDIFFPEARGGWFGLFVELKARSYVNAKGKTVRQRLRPSQRRWQQMLNEAGYLAVTAEGATEALEQLLWYRQLQRSKCRPPTM